MDHTGSIALKSIPLGPQIYTCAHVVRKKPAETVNKITLNNSSPTSKQIPQTLKIQPVSSVPNRRRSCLPNRTRTSVIVSKMASRKPVPDVPDENDDPLKHVDVSVLRKIKLIPPSWMNKRHYAPSRNRSSLQKIVDMMKMKEKSAESNSYRCKPSLSLSPSDRAELQALLHNMKSRDNDPWDTPARHHNYCQLYDCSRRVREPSPPAWVQEDEDPLDFEVAERTPPVDHSKDTHFEFNPRCSPPDRSESEFVFNPVLVKSNLPNLFDFLNPSCPSAQYDEFDHRRMQNNVSPRPYEMAHMNSPSSNWDSSSTSSGQMIAEEKIELTYFKTRGRTVPYDFQQSRIYDSRPEHFNDESFWVGEE